MLQGFNGFRAHIARRLNVGPLPLNDIRQLVHIFRFSGKVPERQAAKCVIALVVHGRTIPVAPKWKLCHLRKPYRSALHHRYRDALSTPAVGNVIPFLSIANASWLNSQVESQLVGRATIRVLDSHSLEQLRILNILKSLKGVNQSQGWAQ